MRNRLFVRPAKPNEAEKMLEWGLKTPENHFDPDAVVYPTTYTLCVYDKDGPFIFMPVQQPQLIDAIAVKPGTDARKAALGLKALVESVVTQSHIKGSGEVLFLATKEETCEFASNQVFEELPYRVFRLKLKDLESND